MIDVVFLLLIFFISTTTLKRAEGVLPSRLPRQSGLASEVAPPITPIVVHVRQTGPGPGDYALRVESFVDTPTTFNELARFLEEIQDQPGFDDETPVVIQASEEVVWDLIVGCWNAAVRAGCKSISFGVQ
jgi:biopolymer transport protein ExbD